MKLPRVDAALETCARHLDSTGTRATEVEAILTAYASAVIYAAFESEARKIVAARASPNGDEHLANFSNTAAVRLMRSIKISELSGTAGLFHGTCKDRFGEALDDEAKAAWDTIVANRHGVAHDQDSEDQAVAISNLTLAELSSLYPKALTVLESLRSAITPAPPQPHT